MPSCIARRSRERAEAPPCLNRVHRKPDGHDHLLEAEFAGVKHRARSHGEQVLHALSEHLKRLRLIVWQRNVPHCGQYGSPSVCGQRIFLNQP